MVICTFCSEEIEKGRGKMFVKNDGKIFRFCSTKCERNMLKLKRVGRKMKWVSKKGKEAKK